MKTKILIISMIFLFSVSCSLERRDGANIQEINFTSEKIENIFSRGQENLEIISGVPRGEKAQCCFGAIFKIYRGHRNGRPEYNETKMGVCFENSRTDRLTYRLKGELSVAKQIIENNPNNRLIAYVLPETKNIELAKRRIKILKEYFIRIGLSAKQMIVL